MWGEHGILRGVGIASPLTPEVRKGELGLRRTMLSMHQIGGFVTLGFMFGAVYAGQRVIDGNRNFRQVHQTFVTGTILSHGNACDPFASSDDPAGRGEHDHDSQDPCLDSFRGDDPDTDPRRFDPPQLPREGGTVPPDIRLRHDSRIYGVDDHCNILRGRP
jgi:hypothetical protein